MAKKSFGDLAVEKGLITKRQLYECMAEQEKLREQGMRTLLSSIMHDKEILTLDQVNELLAELEGSKRKEQIEGYQIISKLGKGGMGTVYLAKQAKLSRLVAIKVLPPRLAHNKEYLARFQREAAATAQLNHSNIVQALDFGESNGYHFFAMEYVEGETVKRYLERTGVVEERRAVEIGIKLASALEHAWQFLLVHRDIKPGNIMIDKDGVVKLCDLGLAIHAKDEDMSITRKGVIMGTPYYMSPEQARMEDLDIRSDLYSLGATFYHMVTGSVPFDGDGAAAVVSKHLTQEMPDPLERNPNLSSGLCLILSRMMAKDKSDRYKDPTELLLDLEQLRDRGILEGKVYKTSADVAAEERRRRLRIAAIVAAGILICLIVFDRRFPGGPSAKVAGLAELRDEWLDFLPKIDERSDAQKKVHQAREFAASHLYSQAEEFAQAQPEQFEEIRDRFREIVDRFGDTSQAPKAKDRLDQVEKQIEQLAREELMTVRQSADASVADGDLAVALGLYAEFPGRYRDTPAWDLKETYRKAIEKEIVIRFRTARERVEEVLLPKGRVSAARELIAPLKPSGIPELDLEIDKLIAHIDERATIATGDAEDAAAAARRKVDETLASAFEEVSGLAVAGSIAEAGDRLSAAARSTEHEVARSGIERIRQDVRRVAAMLARVEAHLRQNLGSRFEIEIDGVARRGTLVKVEKGRVFLKLSKATLGFPLVRAGPAELVRLADMDEEAGETQLCHGVLFALWGRFDESRRHLLRARDMGQDVELYLERFVRPDE